MLGHQQYLSSKAGPAHHHPQHPRVLCRQRRAGQSRAKTSATLLDTLVRPLTSLGQVRQGQGTHTALHTHTAHTLHCTHTLHRCASVLSLSVFHLGFASMMQACGEHGATPWGGNALPYSHVQVANLNQGIATFYDQSSELWEDMWGVSGTTLRTITYHNINVKLKYQSLTRANPSSL